MFKKSLAMIASMMAAVGGPALARSSHLSPVRTAKRRRSKLRDTSPARPAGKLAQLAAEGRVGVRRTGTYGHNLMAHYDRLGRSRTGAH